MSELHKDEDMRNQDLNAQNDNFEYVHFTGEVDSQRGRGAYSSAEKAYAQFNADILATNRANANLAQQQQATIAFMDQDRQQTLRHSDELFHQSLREMEDLHTVQLQILSGANTTDKMDARSSLETIQGMMQALLNKLDALTPPVSTK